MGAMPKVGEVLTDIPPDGRTRGNHHGGARPKHRPLMDAAEGKWVVLYVGTAAPGVAYNIKSRDWFRAGGYEVVNRSMAEPGISAVYGRAIR